MKGIQTTSRIRIKSKKKKKTNRTPNPFICVPAEYANHANHAKPYVGTEVARRDPAREGGPGDRSVSRKKTTIGVR